MIRVCETIEKDLKIIWIKNEDLGSRFTELYQQINHAKISVELVEFESRPFLYSDRLLNNPRQKAFNTLLKVYQRIYFKKVIHASQTAKLKAEGFDFHSLKGFDTAYISSWGRLDHKTFNKTYFIPVDEIKKEIQDFDTPTIGVHIRRTDHQLVIDKTPLDKFISAMDDQLKKEPGVNFYLASDSAEVKSELTRLFGEKVITHSSSNAERSSSKGMHDAMIDLYSLAGTNKIIGTGLSTFTLMASEINGIELIEIR